STINPYTGEKQTAKATSGAVVGSVLGAIVGAATADREDRKKRALQGAGVGALAGGGVGLYMDQQEAKLRQKLEGTGVGVTRSGNDIALNMPSNITFESNSYSLKPEFFEVLQSVALVLKEYKSTLVTIAGHTDSTGSDDLNMTLSRHRATTVAMFLQGEGVDAARMSATGYGEQQPVASNDTPEGRAQNRRVEIRLEPITK
ncbi:MAG: cell envelope biogenesis protein OmpA, partial [Gammaproteobacteria bacterium RBG_16_57_12]